MQTAHHRALMVPHHDRISNFMGLVQPEGRTQNANVRQFYVRTEVTSAVDMLEPRDHSSNLHLHFLTLVIGCFRGNVRRWNSATFLYSYSALSGWGRRNGQVGRLPTIWT